MDMYCTKCGEPWDNDTFHEVAEEQGITYTQAVRNFAREGCKATGWANCTTHVEDGPHVLRADASAALFDLLGDDTDGVMAMMEDFFG